MNEDINDMDDGEEEDSSSRISERRAKRISKRQSARPPGLKRRISAEREAREEKKEEEKEKEKAAEPARTARRGGRRPAERKKPEAKAKKTGGRRTPPRQRREKIAEESEEFEVRSLPDGTQYRVRVSDKKKTLRAPAARRRSRGDAGPGPAVIGLVPGAVSGRKSKTRINLGSITQETRNSVRFLQRNLPVTPRVAVILGSGLSGAADIVKGEAIEYADVPGFMAPCVPGHPGLIRAGLVGGTPTLFSEGRLHYYETGSMRDTVYPIYTFLALGVERIVLTTSAGAVNPSYKAGDIMFVSDQINLMGDNPLFGLDPQSDPPVFVDTSSIYDKLTLDMSERLCRRARVHRRVGVLAGVRGPVYETAAERQWIKSGGADAVCMSVIPEAIAAARVGAPVAALAVITNDASSSGRPVSHGDVAASGESHAADLGRILRSLIAEEY